MALVQPGPQCHPPKDVFTETELLELRGAWRNLGLKFLWIQWAPSLPPLPAAPGPVSWPLHRRGEGIKQPLFPQPSSMPPGCSEPWVRVSGCPQKVLSLCPHKRAAGALDPSESRRLPQAPSRTSHLPERRGSAGKASVPDVECSLFGRDHSQLVIVKSMLLDKYSPGTERTAHQATAVRGGDGGDIRCSTARAGPTPPRSPSPSWVSLQQ